MKRSPVFYILVLSGAFLALVALVFLSRSNDEPQQITMAESVGDTAQPSAENVDPTFHARLMALQQAVEETPRDTSKLLELAHLHQDAHQMAEAAEAYEQLLVVVPDHPQAHLDLALCYSELGRWAEAQATMEALLAQIPDDPAGLYNLGAIHANQGQYEEARNIWERVQAQEEDVHLASQASASLTQLEALRTAPTSQPDTSGERETAATLPADHPPVPLNDYDPVIAGQ